MSATAGYRTPAAPQDGVRPGRLAGRAIVVTRPASQAAPLASAIREAGGEPVLFPTIDILDAAEPSKVQGALAQLADYAWAFFVSPNAVDKTFAHMREWPTAVRVAAVGPGTRAALNQRGVREVLTPATRFDSEGLMQMPEFTGVNGLRCVIFRGNGGRELIASTLAERGASVDLVECYRRALPRTDVGPLLTRWAAGGIDAVTFTSSEGLHNFVELAGASAREIYSDTPAFVPHPRIAATAASFGFRRVVETDAADAGLLAALDQHLGRD